MNLYKVTISPESNFATTLKGDTLFGQMCWSIIHSLGEDKLKELLKTYDKQPFLIISDGFARGYLPKPKIPSQLLGEDSEAKKINRKKIWLTIDQLKKGSFKQALTDEEANNKDKLTLNIHNSINYKSFTTGDDENFAPYGEKEFSFGQKDIYFLIDSSKFSLEDLKKSFNQLSLNGYGKNTTIGKGRFNYGEFKKVVINNSSKTFMTLSPFSPKDIKCKNIYYEPFTRFGKFGGDRAFKNAFKKPILLADTASVVNFEEKKDLQYIGNSIKNISDIHSDAVHQGYSIVIPIKMEID